MTPIIKEKNTPTEEEKDNIFEKYYEEEFKQKTLEDIKLFKRLQDEKTQSTEIHNIVFNKTLRDAQKRYKKPGNVRNYGVVKKASEWFRERVGKLLFNEEPTEENLKNKFPEKFEELRQKLSEFSSIKSYVKDNWRGSGESVLISEIRNKKGRWITWKIANKGVGFEPPQKNAKQQQKSSKPPS